MTGVTSVSTSANSDMEPVASTLVCLVHDRQQDTNVAVSCHKFESRLKDNGSRHPAATVAICSITSSDLNAHGYCQFRVSGTGCAFIGMNGKYKHGR